MFFGLLSEIVFEDSLLMEFKFERLRVLSVGFNLMLLKQPNCRRQ